MPNLSLADALKATGLTSAAAFRSKYGVGLKIFTSAELLALLTRVSLLDRAPPPSIKPEDWEHVCAIADLVYERPAASSIGSSIPTNLRTTAERINFPVVTGEDLHNFARRFDIWAHRLANGKRIA